MKHALFITSILTILIFASAVNATETFNESVAISSSNADLVDNTAKFFKTSSQDLEREIENANDSDQILIEPGAYKLNNIQITKSITLQGNGDARNIIINGEKKSSIFLIKNPEVHVTFKNITFINGQTNNFGGAICSESGHVTVDNCIFINNTALDDTNAGGISNYGTNKNKGYLLVNNSLFINNHADHDGGAITTCYADSYIYNSVFINNSAVRDGGAIRVSVKGYSYVEDCIFMFNHADEWGGAYYSWSGESDIRRCIFMNNTAGTNGGAVMVSGNINLQDSIITNNDGGQTGGSFYIQQPMYDAKTNINVHNNIITNNTSPLGKEIFLKWDDIHNLYPDFNDNDWGDEDPNDSSINDPNNVTSRIKVSKTIKSNLFGRLNLDLLDKYSDLLKDYFPDDSLNELKNKFYTPKTNKSGSNNNPDNKKVPKHDPESEKTVRINKSSEDAIDNNVAGADSKQIPTSNTPVRIGNSTSLGKQKKAYELNETGGSVAKQANEDIEIFIAIIALALVLLAIGYRREKKNSK